MVEKQIVARGISDAATLRAMRTVPRHLFVLPEYEKEAYSDRPLPIGYNQTISRTILVAVGMTELARPLKGKIALEIIPARDTRQPYLPEIVDTVYTIEIVPELAWESTADLQDPGIWEYCYKSMATVTKGGLNMPRLISLSSPLLQTISRSH